jgi:hypothetical protein
MVKTTHRPARMVHVWLKPPYTLSDVDSVRERVSGWHASTYPSSVGDPLQLAFFDHEKADAAVAVLTSMSCVENASPFYCFERGRAYRVHGETPEYDYIVRFMNRRGMFAELVREDSCGNVVPGSRVRKQLRIHTKTNSDRGEYVQIDEHARVYAADDASE